MDFKPIQGGCQCGAVRYTLTAPPREVLHCHCSLCRKAHGALFASFGVYDASALTIEHGTDGLGDYESSPGSHRQFCGRCGCQLFNRIDKWPDRAFVLLGTLDIGALPGHGPASERHIFWDSRVHWYDVGEDGRRRDAAWPGP
jgi:hypothetical protein